MIQAGREGTWLADIGGYFDPKLHSFEPDTALTSLILSSARKESRSGRSGKMAAETIQNDISLGLERLAYQISYLIASSIEPLKTPVGHLTRQTPLTCYLMSGQTRFIIYHCWSRDGTFHIHR